MYKEWLLVDAWWQEQSGVLRKQYPTLTSEIVMELFLSKGHFHQYWNKLFSLLSHYPVLEAWFNCEPSALTPTSIKAWGSSKHKPKFADLEKRLTDLGATWVGTKFVPLHSNLDSSSSSSSQSTHNTCYMSSNDKKKKKKKKNFIFYLFSILLPLAADTQVQNRWLVLLSQAMVSFGLLQYAFTYLPCVSADTPGVTYTDFPDITWATFNSFVDTNFNPDIKLHTVLITLFKLSIHFTAMKLQGL
ncbi:hypothetical protein FA15DRAFT_661564 [Coprinopsis marcescibilis]|uniref:Uncharacterized protein n=1 Tax=Coprinopsis marcescibilis TaxID=230819 RepID=A0A5C3KBZ5_COPMA|nr:hypothetical protein FA15DRAFT_661564 [Coprinopsis marcescibilis]